MNVEDNDNEKAKDTVEDDKGCKVYHRYNLAPGPKGKAFHEGGKYPDDKDEKDDADDGRRRGRGRK